MLQDTDAADKHSTLIYYCQQKKAQRGALRLNIKTTKGGWRSTEIASATQC